MMVYLTFSEQCGFINGLNEYINIHYAKPICVGYSVRHVAREITLHCATHYRHYFSLYSLYYV